MQKQALAAIENTAAEKIVPDEGKTGNSDDVPVERYPGAARLSLLNHNLCAQGAIPVHVFDVAFDGGIGMMNEVVVQRIKLTIEGNGFVDGTLCKSRSRCKVRSVITKEAKFGIGIVAAMVHPSIEE